LLLSLFPSRLDSTTDSNAEEKYRDKIRPRQILSRRRSRVVSLSHVPPLDKDVDVRGVSIVKFGKRAHKTC